MTNFANEQLEAWAGLGPWRALGTTWDAWDVMEVHTANADCDDDPIAHLYKVYPWPEGAAADPFRNDKTNAALIAAAPALAAALLAERKAREVEVGELRAAAEDLVSLCSADVKMNGTTYQPMPYRSAFTKAVERVIEALKGPTP
jgi:hypothetical protein